MNAKNSELPKLIYYLSVKFIKLVRIYPIP